MRRQTAPQTRKHRPASSHKQAGLIAQDAQQSATAGSRLDNHSHRTRLRLTFDNIITTAPPNYADLDMTSPGSSPPSDLDPLTISASITYARLPAAPRVA
jgi:hypothetical protein